jgi:tetratricopeptide (TPR) repeat protein
VRRLFLIALALLLAGAADPRLARARTLLWTARYAEAEKAFQAILADNPRDVEARRGLAQAYYWSGDFRHAAAEFAALPHDPQSQRALAEIRAASRPGYAVEGSTLDDDQPYRARGTAVRAYWFSDPLTKWEIDAGAARLVDRDVASFGIAGETGLPPIHATLKAAAAWMRFPDDTKKLLPSVAVDERLGATTLTVAAADRPLLRSRAALLTHPTANVVSARWWRGDAWAIHAEHLGYFDHNRGNAADAFYLRPFGAMAFGASAAWRDTAESRFRGGVYDPYWTPMQQREVRAIAAAAWKRASLHLDGGIAHDSIAGTFHPWRAALTVGTGTFRVIAEHNVTAFYRSNEIRASLAGRF